MKTRLTIRKSRNVRDILTRRSFVVVDRLPGGREIIHAKEATRKRAYKKALMEARPQSSLTAGAGLTDAAPAAYGGDAVSGDWMRSVYYWY